MSSSQPAVAVAAAAAGDATSNINAPTQPAASAADVVLDQNEDFAVVDVNIRHHVPDFTITHHLVQGAPAPATVSPTPQAVDAGMQTVSPTAPPSSSAALAAQSDAFAAGPPGILIVKEQLDATAEVFKNMLYKRCLGPKYARDDVTMEDAWVPILETAVESVPKTKMPSSSSSAGLAAAAATPTKAKMPSSSSSAGLAAATTPKTKTPASSSLAGLADAATPKTKMPASSSLADNADATPIPKTKTSSVTFADLPGMAPPYPRSKASQTSSPRERTKLRERQKEAEERVQRQQQQHVATVFGVEASSSASTSASANLAPMELHTEGHPEPAEAPPVSLVYHAAEDSNPARPVECHDYERRGAGRSPIQSSPLPVLFSRSR